VPVTVFYLIKAGSYIPAGSLMEARESKGEYHRANCTFAGISLCSNKYKTKNLGDVLIEAGSPIQTGSLTEAGGLRTNTIELIAHPPVFCFAVINKKPRILVMF